MTTGRVLPLFAVAAVLIILSLVLPVGRELWVTSFAQRSIIRTDFLNAFEMGRRVDVSTGIVPAGVEIGQDFASATSLLGGEGTESPVQMLLSGRYLLANGLLVIPFLASLWAFFWVRRRPASRRPTFVASGLVAVAGLLAWWGVWVKFRTVPAGGYWLSLLGSLLLVVAGLVRTRTAAE